MEMMVLNHAIAVLDGSKGENMSSNDCKREIVDIVLQHKGTVIDYRNDGLIVLDKTGKRIHRIKNDFDTNENVFSENKHGLIAFFDEKELCAVTLHLFLNDIGELSFRDSVMDFVTAISEQHQLHLSVFFQESPVSWRDSLSAFCGCS